METKVCLTIFLVPLFVQVHVGLHVPDELMRQELRLLSRPQDVLSHVAHLHNQTSQTNVDRGPTEFCPEFINYHNLLVITLS